MNQYGHVRIIHQPCAASDCRNMVRLTPSAIAKNRRFCSSACARKQPRKFKQTQIDYIMSHVGIVMYKDMAKHLGVTLGSFTHLLHRLRCLGYALPMRSKKAYGLKKKKLSSRKSKTNVMSTQLTKDGRPDKRGNRPLTSPGIRDHMKRKPPVEGAKPKPEDKPLKRRKIVEGEIKVVFNDKNKTTFSCVDEAHAERVRKRFAYLNEPLIASKKLR